MPAAAPDLSPSDKDLLTRLGAQLKRVRLEQKVSAVAAAAIHDNNLSPPDPANPGLTDQQIVNWPVFNAVVRQMTDTIGNIWQNLTRKA